LPSRAWRQRSARRPDRDARSEELMAAENSPIDHDLIRDLAKLLDETGLTDIEVERGGVRLRVARQASPAAPAVMMAPPVAVSVPAAAGAGVMSHDPASHPGVVLSPMVGTAYRAPEPGAKPFVDIGTVVKAGDT